MSLRILLRVVLAAAVLAFVYWVATHTYWADEVVPRSPRGAALIDPFYGAERLVRALGAQSSNERLWRLPPPDAIVVAGYWDWDRSRAERSALQQWVDSGGRLVVEWGSLIHDKAFSDWSGITLKNGKGHKVPWKAGGCRDEAESVADPSHASATAARYELCGLYGDNYLASTRAPIWQVSDAYGAQALRIRIGRGTVSVINGDPITYLEFLKGDDPQLFVAATALHRGDAVYFLSDQDHASLLALAWRFGAPVVLLLLGALLLALWRAAPRFGPAMASPERARRSLAEQIRGTGQFLLRVGDGEALHAATLRALFAAAPRRISAFSSLPSAERVSRLARETGFSATELASAINYTGARRTHELRSAIALLEAARREILRNKNGSTNGN